MTTFANQVALVTGASSGVGKSIAVALADQGAALCMVGRNEDRLKAAADLASAVTAHVYPLRADLTVDDDIERLSSCVRAEFGRLDILVHSAGDFARGPIEGAPVDQLDAQYRANVRAPYLLTQRLLPLLREHGGDVVFINSTAGLSASAEVSQFSATQHALKALADSLRQEVNADGVRVLNVFLGRTATPRQERIYERQGWGYQPELLLQPDDVAAIVVGSLALARRAEVTEIRIRPTAKSY